MPQNSVRFLPSVNPLPDSDPLNVAARALRAAVEAAGAQGQLQDEVGRFASLVGAYENIRPLQSLALARMQQFLWEGNSKELPGPTVRWHRDPLSSDPLASTIPRALSGLRKAIFADTLGGTLMSPNAQDAVKNAFAALTARLAPPNQTAIIECQAAITIDNVPGRLSSWALVATSDSRYVVLYVTSFAKNTAPSPGDA